MKGLSDERRDCRLTFYDGGDGIGCLRCSDAPFDLTVAQCFMKTAYAKKFKFPKNGISDSFSHEITNDPDTEGTSTVTLTLSGNGSVKAEVVDEGYDCDGHFRDTCKSSCNLVVLTLDDFSAEALAAFKCSDGSVWWVRYTIADADEDGTLDDLEITDTVVFWEW